MFEDDEEPSGLYYSLVFETKIIRILETLIIPNTIKIRADVSVDTDMHSLGMAKATLKIKSWIDTVLNSSLIMSSDNIEGGKMFFDGEGNLRAINNVMLTPGAPTDDMLSVLIQAKFDALAGKNDTFILCEVRSDNVLGLRSTFIGSAKEFLPSIKEWLGERNYFDEPWWNRDDASTFDVVPPPDADLSRKPDWAKPVGTSGFDFDLAAPNSASAEKTPSVILRPSFKPKVIDGGKKPDA